METFVLSGRKAIQDVLRKARGAQASEAETPQGSDALQSTSQGFLDINLHGLVLIAFELFSYAFGTKTGIHNFVHTEMSLT